MRENTILNAIVWTASCAAIGVACYVTKRATPLIALCFIPTWKYSEETTNGPKSFVNDTVDKIKEFKKDEEAE